MEERFARQILLPEIGASGQARLKQSAVLVVGCGGLGSALLYCLCGMGVGRVGFADGDVVSPSNLNRQFLHTPKDIGRMKTDSAYARLSAFATDVLLEPIACMLTRENAATYVSRYDVVALAVDSIEARLIVNEACVGANRPLVDGGVNGFYGQVMAVRPNDSACLACVYADAKDSAACKASFAPVVTMTSAMEAQLTAEILLGLDDAVYGAVTRLDGRALTTRRIPIARAPRCPVCAKRE